MVILPLLIRRENHFIFFFFFFLPFFFERIIRIVFSHSLLLHEIENCVVEWKGDVRFAMKKTGLIYSNNFTSCTFFFSITTPKFHSSSPEYTVAILCAQENSVLPSEELSVFLYLVIDLIKQRGIFSRR